MPFCPLYLTKQYEEDKKKIEMSFDLSIYQPQFRKGKDRQKNVTGPVTTEEQQDHQRSDAEQDSQDHDHVYQTIFLDRDGSQQLWTWDEIKEDKRIKEKWWKQVRAIKNNELELIEANSNRTVGNTTSKWYHG